MDDSIMGEWRMCADGRCHHFLRGVVLCGKKAKPTGPVPLKAQKYPAVSTYCVTCQLLNAERWLQPDGQPRPAVDTAAGA